MALASVAWLKPHRRFAALASGLISAEPPPCMATACGVSLLQGQDLKGDRATSAEAESLQERRKGFGHPGLLVGKDMTFA